jgi:hypothetical protein
MPGDLSIKSLKVGGDARSDAASGYNTFAFAGVPDGFFGTSKTSIIAAAVAFSVIVIAITVIKTKKRG